MLSAGATWVWPLALALYLAFRLWYDGWRGPLSTQEIEQFMQAAGQTVGAGHTDMSVLRDFLVQDDGREFVMCNLVRLHPQAMPHPLTGVMTEPSALLREYFRQFVPVLLMNGGHPIIAARKVAGYIDAWNTPVDPGWSVAGMMRYRSRRDMMRLAIDPRFTNAHPFKMAAVEQTFSFPTQPVGEMGLRPRSAVGLLLMLLAALVHLGSLLLLPA